MADLDNILLRTCDLIITRFIVSDKIRQQCMDTDTALAMYIPKKGRGSTII